MRLKNIKATPHPNGNRIDLRWENPAPEEFPNVRVYRREGTHPSTLDDGTLVAEKKASLFRIDMSFQNDLDAEDLSSALKQTFLDNQVSLSAKAELSTVEQGKEWRIRDAERCYLLRKHTGHITVYEAFASVVDEGLKSETVYHYTLFSGKENSSEYHFDRHNRVSAMATAPYNMAGQMAELLPAIYHRYDTKGHLRSFLDLPGSQLDQLYSFARAMLDLHDIDKVDGALLPLLAEWIGWPTDYRQEIASQRNQIRNAPYLYQTIGIIPTIEATVRRLTGEESHVKEFVHNVFLSNRPERLNLYTLKARFKLTEQAFKELRDENIPEDVLETLKPLENKNFISEETFLDAIKQLIGEEQTARYKTLILKHAAPTELLSLDFAYEGRPAAVYDETDGTIRLFYHTRKTRYDIDARKRRVTCDIWYKTYHAELGWAPSQPLTNRLVLDKHPAAVMQGRTLWVFWDTYDEGQQSWHISYRKQTDDGKWSKIQTVPDNGSERRSPWAVVDSHDDVWLFYVEKSATQWQLKYCRYAEGGWEAADTIPSDNGAESGGVSDLFALFHPNQSLWVFWARKSQSHQTRWRIVCRVKQSISDDWISIDSLPGKDENPDYHDREPAACVIDAGGNVEVFWSSNRENGWAIWRNVIDIQNYTWGDAEKVTDTPSSPNPYSQRNPLPLVNDEGRLLFYRSNESLSYGSEAYKATETVDFRYAGCTTIDTRNSAKNLLKGRFEDFQTYTYDIGKEGERTELDWYARDTVGIYVPPDVFYNRNRIQDVLKQFLPIQVRAVFAVERVHTYDVETWSGLRDSYQDTVHNRE